MSDLVGNPNCWFSHAKAHLKNAIRDFVLCFSVRPKKKEATEETSDNEDNDGDIDNDDDNDDDIDDQLSED